MSRTVQITVLPNQTDNLLGKIKGIGGIIGLRVQRGISVQPSGDVITVETMNHSLSELMRLLDRHEIGHRPGSSIATSEPISVISPSSGRSVMLDVSESTWEEMETVIGKESNASVNTLIVMAIAGIFATIGIGTNALHLVLAAMIVAPGFEPISRIALGIVAQSRGWQHGLSHTLQAYVSMILGAAVTTFILLALGKQPLSGDASYLQPGVLVSYWTSLSASSLLIAISASIAGALLIATNRAVLTAGVMIALALVPSIVIATMALVAGDLALSARGLLRWLIEASCVLILSVLVFAWKRTRVQRRKMML